MSTLRDNVLPFIKQLDVSWKNLVIWFVLTIVYIAAGRLGLLVAVQQSQTTPIWLPGGIALAAVILFGLKVWPGIFLGALITPFFTGLPIIQSLTIALGNTAETLLAYYLLTKRCIFDIHLSRGSDVLYLTFFGALPGPALSAAFGCLALIISGVLPANNIVINWLTWWLGNLTGILSLTPALLIWFNRDRPKLNPGQIFRIGAYLTAVVGLIWLVYSGNFDFPYLIFPILLIVVFQTGIPGTTLAIPLLSAISVFFTANSGGPFIIIPPLDGLLNLQIFNAIVAFTILLLAAVLQEKKTALEIVDRNRQELETLVDERTCEISAINARLEQELAVLQKAQESLSQSESNLDAILNNTLQAFFLLNKNGEVLASNRLAADLFCKVTNHTLLEGMNVKDIFRYSDQYQFQQFLERVLDGETIKFERSFHLENREQRFEFSCTPVTNDENEVTGACISLLDVTEQHETAEKLRRSEEHYRTLAAASPSAIFRTDLDGVINYVSDHTLSLFKASAKEEILGTTIFDWIEKSDHAHLLANMQVARLHPSTFQEQCTQICKDGSRFIGEIAAGVQQSPSSEPQGFVFVTRDITQREQAAVELSHSLALLQSVIESTEDGITVVHLDGRLLNYNHKFEEMWQMPEGWQLLPDRHDRLRLLARLAKDPDTFIQRINELYDHPDQSGYDMVPLLDGRWIERYSSPFRSGDRIVGRIWNFRDVTARELSKRELELANLKLVNSIHEMEQRNHEMSLLAEMGSMLQSCVNEKEACAVIADYASNLFPEQSGAMFLLDPDQGLARLAAEWGNNPTIEHTYPPDNCWALRRGRPHTVTRAGQHFRCPRVVNDPAIGEGVYGCYPLIAQGEALGTFNIHGSPSNQSESWAQLGVAVAEHISMALANIRLRESLRIQSIRDSLTGLYNRRFLDQSLERELHRAARHAYPVGLIMLDIDHFKNYNDQYGHEIGDQMLRTLGHFLETSIRAEDFACRYGGEEFLIILPDTSREECTQRAIQICSGVRNLAGRVPGLPTETITVSLGVAVFPADGETVEKILKASDQALYRAKAAGRNRVEVAS